MRKLFKKKKIEKEILSVLFGSLILIPGIFPEQAIYKDKVVYSNRW